MLGSKFVWFKNFMEFFQGKYFFAMLRNTIAISLMNIVFFFPAPIILALLLNEIKSEKVRRVHQTLLYMPHFMSWVVITGLTFFLLSIDIGLIPAGNVKRPQGSRSGVSLAGRMHWKDDAPAFTRQPAGTFDGCREINTSNCPPRGAAMFHARATTVLRWL